MVLRIIDSMKLAVIAATGRIGEGLTQEALDQGHHVTALVRTPEKLTIKHDNLTVSTDLIKNT